MAKTPERPKKPGKTPKSKAHRPELRAIGPALAELLNPAINRGESGIGSSTGLQPPPDNSWDRRTGGEAAAHRARASTRGKSEDVARRDASEQNAGEQATSEAEGLSEAPQARYGTTATVPMLDPELARHCDRGLPLAAHRESAVGLALDQVAGRLLVALEASAKEPRA